LSAEGGAAAMARHVAASRPDLVRGVVLIAEPPAAGTEARRDSPVGAVLRINAGGADDEFGSRATDLRIDGGDGALLGTRTDATVDAILRWIDGPSLSSAQAGRRIEQPTDVAAMSAEQRRLDQALRESLQTAAGRRVGVLGPRGVLLNDPRLLQGYLGIGDAVANAPVPLRYKELAILLTARALDSDYEWYAHERPALNAGVPPDAVAAIRRGQPHRFARADDQIVYDYVDEFHRTHRVGDTTYRRAWDLLGTAGLVNLTMVVGHYMGVATNLNAHGLRPPGDFTPLPPRTTR
jgi:alkylhydroperoxidase family enzyme